MTEMHPIRSRPAPRQFAYGGPVVLSGGFRPFFLAAGIWAVLAMGLWMVCLWTGLPIGYGYGGAAWHAHEMLFGYTSAALAGYLLTVIPNWTGRIPVHGTPLAVLFAIWLAGRVAMIWPDIVGLGWALGIDMLFLPLIFVFCFREVVAGRRWRDLKILAAVLALTFANASYHTLIVGGDDTAVANRMAISTYIMLIGIVGGRIVPSFTRNWLARRQVINLPAPSVLLDTMALLAGLAGLSLWVVWPNHLATAIGCAAACALHAIRLARWQSWQTAEKRSVLVLHLAYAAVPIGFLAIALVPWGVLDATSALHVFTVGAIGLMTLAIMSRATRGHTGMHRTAVPLIATSYGFLVAAALLRPGAMLMPDQYMTLVSLSGLCWMAAFTLYLVAFAPALLTRRQPLTE